MKSVPLDPRDAVGVTAPPQPMQALESLSALADGDAQAMHAGCALWRDDAAARQAWHSYHLIGDVMRSDDLAVHPARDQAFLAGIRARLAAEPVVLAPAPAAPRRRQPWLLPAAAVAGVAVVAGVLAVARVGMPGAAPGASPLMAHAPGVASPPLQTVSVDGQAVLRDPRLEELVRQHHATHGSIAATVPRGLRPQPVNVER